MTKKRREIRSWDEVPSFASEAEERAWWDEHEVSEELLQEFEPRAETHHLPPPREKTVTRPRKGAISVRMEDDLVDRLKALAAIKGVGYQVLLTATSIKIDPEDRSRREQTSLPHLRR